MCSSDLDSAQRMAGTNRSLFPDRIDGVVVAADPLRVQALVDEAADQFDHLVVVTSEEGQTPWAADGVDVVTRPGEGRRELVNAGVDWLGCDDWVVVLDEDVRLEPGFVQQLRDWVLNPGCRYEFPRHQAWADRGRALIRTDTGGQEHDLRDSGAFCAVFNMRARSLRASLASGVHDVQVDLGSADNWPADKRIDLHRFLLQPDPLRAKRRFGREMARHVTALWQGLLDCGLRPALFGAGHHTQWFLRLLQADDLAMPALIFDDDPYSYDMCGVDIVQPDTADTSAFDVVVISADPGRMTEILKRRSREVWGDTKGVVDMYRGYPEGRFMKVDRE